MFCSLDLRSATLFCFVAMETKRYSLAVVSNLLLNGSWKKDIKTSLCLSQPGGRNSQGLMPSSQVGKLFFRKLSFKAKHHLVKCHLYFLLKRVIVNLNAILNP